MKKFIFSLLLFFICAASLRADEQVAAVQLQLKNQGFYYGEVDGNSGPETSAAIKRFQIRNGLKVTGNLTKETLAALNVAGDAPVAARQPAPQAPGIQPTPVQTNHSISESDRDFLRKQAGPATPPSPVTPAAPPAPQPVERDQDVAAQPVAIPQRPNALAAQYIAMFRRTPYENAPIGVQQNTLKSAQWRLIREQYYNGAVDGIPGPSTVQSIVLFQQASRLPQTGRLDMDTLSELRLLPNGNRTVVQPFYPPPNAGPQRVYRGIWVQ